MGGVSIISGTLFRVRQEPFLTSKIIRRLHSGRIKKITAESEKISTENIKNNLDNRENK